jgi:hypothetical protein
MSEAGFAQPQTASPTLLYSTAQCMYDVKVEGSCLAMVERQGRAHMVTLVVGDLPIYPPHCVPVVVAQLAWLTD